MGPCEVRREEPDLSRLTFFENLLSPLVHDSIGTELAFTHPSSFSIILSLVGIRSLSRTPFPCVSRIRIFDSFDSPYIIPGIIFLGLIFRDPFYPTAHTITYHTLLAR